MLTILREELAQHPWWGCLLIWRSDSLGSPLCFSVIDLNPLSHWAAKVFASVCECIECWFFRVCTSSQRWAPKMTTNRFSLLTKKFWTCSARELMSYFCHEIALVYEINKWQLCYLCRAQRWEVLFGNSFQNFANDRRHLQSVNLFCADRNKMWLEGRIHFYYYWLLFPMPLAMLATAAQTYFMRWWQALYLMPNQSPGVSSWLSNRNKCLPQIDISHIFSEKQKNKKKRGSN